MFGVCPGVCADGTPGGKVFRYDYHDYRSGCMRWFGGPDKEMRSISRADKLWQRFAVGMERSGMT
jgi:hypothetical protein